MRYDFFQFTSISNPSLMKNAVFLSSSQCILYENEGELFKVNFEDNSQTKLLIKKSTIENQNHIVHIGVSKNDNIFSVSKGNGIKLLKIEDGMKVTKTSQLGFICVYCLAKLKTSKALTTEHMNLHIGPVMCSKCQVKFCYPNTINLL